jgi:hypothetical protein
MAAYLAQAFNTQILVGNTVAANHLLYTYESGTTTPKTVYKNQAGTVAHTNPIVLNADGSPPGGVIWVTSGECTFTLKTALGAEVWTRDDIAGSSSSGDVSALRADLLDDTDAAKGSAIVGDKQSDATMTDATVSESLRSLEDATGVNVTKFMSAAQYADFKSGALAQDLTDVFQAAIDYALQNKLPKVICPPGKAKITDTIHLGYGVDFATIVLEGLNKPGSVDLALDSTLYWMGPLDRPVVNIQGGRSSGLRRIAVQYDYDSGYNTIQTILANVHLMPDIANWSPPGAVTTETNAFCGVCVDAYSGTAPVNAYPSVTYPAWLGGSIPQYGKALTSRPVIEECKIWGFYIGAFIHPQNTGNGDFPALSGTSINYCGIGIKAAHSNARLMDVQSCDLGHNHTCYTNVTAALTTGGNNTANFNNVVMDYCYQWFDVESNQAWHISNCYGELIVQIGKTAGGAATASYAKFSGCNVTFIRNATSGNSRIVPLYFADIIGNFDACTFSGIYGVEHVRDYYGGIGTGVGFNNCQFNNAFALSDFPTASAPESVALAQTGGLLISPGTNRNKRTPKIQSSKFSFNYANGTAFPGIDISNSIKTIHSIGSDFYGSQREYLLPSYACGVTVTLASVSVTGLVLSATATVNYTSPPAVGDVMQDSIGRLYVVQSYNSGTGALTALICTGYTINGASVVSITGTAPANGTFNLFRAGRYATSYTGMAIVCTSGSAVVTLKDVTGAAVADATPYFSAGDTILVCPATYHATINPVPFIGFVTVVSVAAGNITVNKNALATMTVADTPTLCR